MINNFVLELQSGCYSGMCSNKKVLTQIRNTVSELEIKMFAFTLVMKMEGRGVTIEKLQTKEVFKVPGRLLNSRKNDNQYKSS
jgi:hypothetical protein